MGPLRSIDPSLTLFSLHKDMHRNKTFHSGPRQNLQISQPSRKQTAYCPTLLSSIAHNHYSVSSISSTLTGVSPLEYLFAAPFLCIFRIYNSRKAQNYLSWLWINLISNHIKKKTDREFYWNKVFCICLAKKDATKSMKYIFIIVYVFLLLPLVLQWSRLHKADTVI